MAKYEWFDEMRWRHPSMVVVDGTEHQSLWTSVKEMPILQVKRIDDLRRIFNPSGYVDGRKLPRVKGYRFQAYQKLMECPATVQNGEEPWYALVLVYVKKEEEVK